MGLKMNKSSSKILIIDDSVTPEDYRVKDLKFDYEDVLVLNTPDSAVEFIYNNLDERFIAVLDYSFAKDIHTGKYVLDMIRDKTQLLPVILWTAYDDDVKEYPEFINQGTFAVVAKANYDLLREKIKEADEKLSNSVDGALEEWISHHSGSDRYNSFLVSSSGEKLSLDQILSEIRMQTETGRYFEKILIKLTIDRLMRKEK
ncbi:DNA-binding transcriptional response regulator [Adhaeribacter soli]|uniref:Response regulator n=1 Tax=Adhaeribacter soli TaxID=2607655 RepID=A0A5N1INV6_9BACT|nr:response regulator [Adhaeribacter soli]KAA9325170.1 response regulator [Adhaeribacter soli]